MISPPPLRPPAVIKAARPTEGGRQAERRETEEERLVTGADQAGGSFPRQEGRSRHVQGRIPRLRVALTPQLSGEMEFQNLEF